MSDILDESKMKVKSNLLEAKRFLEALAGNSPLTFETFDDRKKNRRLARVFHGHVKDLQSDLVLLNCQVLIVVSLINGGQ